MRYFAKIRGSKDQIPVDIEAAGPGRYVVTLNGKRHEIDALTLDHGAVSMLIDDKSYSVEFDPLNDEVAVLVKNHVAIVDVADERSLRLRAGATQFSVEGKQTVT